MTTIKATTADVGCYVSSGGDNTVALDEYATLSEALNDVETWLNDNVAPQDHSRSTGGMKTRSYER